MSDIKQEVFWPGSGLNTDDSYEFMPNGDSPRRLNILVGEDGANGVITNMLGNSRTVDISDHELILSHTYQVVGSYYNRLTRRVYYFIFSQPYEIPTSTTTSSTSTTTTTDDGTGLVIDYTSGDFQYDNRLLCYYEDTQELDLIFIDTKNWFGINPAYPMRDMEMIGNWLYFNPRVSEPKIIDVEMAYNYTTYDAYDATLTYIYGDYVTYFGGLFRANTAIAVGETPVSASTKWDRVGDSYQNETDLDYTSEFYYAFNVIKHPPISRPICSYGTDTDKNANNVRGKLFRFSHRYKYFDNSYSVWGAYTDVTLPVNDEYYNGEILGDIDYNNYIKVAIKLHSAALVKEIEIAFQEIGTDIWKRAKVINRQDIELLNELYYTYNFYNTDSAYETIDRKEVAKVEDVVPRLANSQEVLNKNILAYGGVTEGFPNIDKNLIAVTLTPTIEAITIPDDIDTVRRDLVADFNIGTPYWDEDGDMYKTDIDFISWYAGAGIALSDVMKVTYNGIEKLHTVIAGDIVDVDSFTSMVETFMLTEFFIYSSIDSPGILTLEGARNFTDFIIYSTGATVSALTKKRGFKTGAWHPFCIFYYDKSMRRWEAQTSKELVDGAGYTIDGTSVYIPMLNEYSPLPGSTAYRWLVNWTINHLPPDGAKYWRWGYAGNALCSYFVQYTITAIADATQWTSIDIAPLQNLKTVTTGGYNQFPQSNIEPYQWVKGDRVRILTEKSVPPAMGALLDGVYDYEIVKYDETTTPGQYLIYIAEAYADLNALDIGADSLIEIYRPIKSDTLPTFFEFGELMPIIEESDNVFVHGVGSTGTADQVYATDTPASGRFEYGDVYHILRTPSKPINSTTGYFMESQWYSDFYASDDWDKGKVGIETTFGQRFLNIIRYSRPYFQNTLINGLPTFDSDRYKELNDTYGEIVAIYELGDTLKVYQERKASSIGIGRTEYVDAEGRTTVTTSDRVLGSIRYSPSNYSTVFPESISRNNKFIYGFDVYNGVMWRDGVNGIFPISGRYDEAGMSADYKMATYFKDKAKALLTSGIDHVDVLSVWDEEFKLLYVVFKDYVLEENIETIVFHEPSNRWITFASLDQTPANGYNVILELSYDIVKGFEGGLGYWFDEETRFAVFDIITTANVGTDVGADEAVLTLTAYPPTSVTCSAELTPANVDITLTPYPPTDVHISYTHLSVDTFNWTGGEAGDGVKIATVVSISEATAKIANKASWITLEGNSGILNVGDTVVNGETIYLYPTSSNTGAARSATFDLITDAPAYTNTASVTVSQSQDGTNPIINYIGLHGSEPTLMTITPNYGNSYATLGSADVYIVFTPDHPDHGVFGGFTMYWQMTKNVLGIIYEIGTGTFTAMDETENSVTLTATEALTAGLEIDINFATEDVF